MPKLTQIEREDFTKIIVADLGAIRLRVVQQIEHLWETSRAEIIKERGLDAIKEEKEELREQIDVMQERLKELERALSPDNLTVHQEIEMGGTPGKYDRFQGANFFGIPVQNELDYAIVQKIKETVDTEAPAKYLNDLGASCLREITMSGTFEEAKKVYEDFYALDFRKYGVDIPPRLKELREAKEVGTNFMLDYKKPAEQLPSVQTELEKPHKKRPKKSESVEVA